MARRSRRNPSRSPRPSQRAPQPRRPAPRPQGPAATSPAIDGARAGVTVTLRRYLIAGLLVWVPLGITIWVLAFLINTLDQTLLLLPESARPEAVFGFRIPGLGVVLSAAILLLTGAIAANFFGARLIGIWESVLGRIPFVKSIYSSVKQVSDTLLSEKGNAFRKALLVEYAAPGSWTIAFLTGAPAPEVAEYLPGDHVSVYVPTTPNPTSGFFLMLPRSRVHELDMTVDEALKYIISMGVVAPRQRQLAPPRSAPAAATQPDAGIRNCPGRGHHPPHPRR